MEDEAGLVLTPGNTLGAPSMLDKRAAGRFVGSDARQSGGLAQNRAQYRLYSRSPERGWRARRFVVTPRGINNVHSSFVLPAMNVMSLCSRCATVRAAQDGNHPARRCSGQRSGSGTPFQKGLVGKQCQKGTACQEFSSSFINCPLLQLCLWAVSIARSPDISARHQTPLARIRVAQWGHD